MKPWCVTIQMKANEQYFHVVSSSMLNKLNVIEYENSTKQFPLKEEVF